MRAAAPEAEIEPLMTMKTFLAASVGVSVLALTARYALRGVGKGSPKNYIRGGFLKEMTRAEASRILDVPQSAAVKEVRARHRKLMMANHPDGGGSPYLATKVNEAKDTLLGKK